MENFIKIAIDDRNYCIVNLFGATITNWVNNEKEYLFLSSKAKFDNKNAIRGGIPIIFPCFGPWSLGPQHGFARISFWTLKHKQNNENYATAVFTISHNEETIKMWNFKFVLDLTVTITKDSLITSLQVTNNDISEFNFTTLFHTYFKTPNIENIKIEGLNGCQLIDKILDKTNIETRDIIVFDKAVDSVYQSTPNIHLIHNVTENKSIRIEKKNLPDTVLWNPWREKAMQMSDLGAEFDQMVCVEAGHVTQPIYLSPMHSYTATQTLTIT